MRLLVAWMTVLTARAHAEVVVVLLYEGCSDESRKVRIESWPM